MPRLSYGGKNLKEDQDKKAGQNGGFPDLSRPKAILSSRGLAPKKRWGQNFLIREDLAERIAGAAGLKGDELVFEIGPGLGALSVFLARQAKELVLLEIDPDLSAWLKELFAGYPQVEIIQGNALDCRLSALARQRGFEEYIIMGNLPYYITTPLIKDFLEGTGWQTMVLMVQKEAARRLAAPAGGKDYGPLNVRLQYQAKLEILMDVPAGAFYPAPDVVSTVIRLSRLAEKPVQVEDEGLFYSIVESALAQRRKTVLNALYAGDASLSKADWAGLLSACGIEAARRGETLALAEFAALANAYKVFLPAP